MRRGPPPSLKARALQLLAQRDQSRIELRRKLLAHARKLSQDPLQGPLSRLRERAGGEGRPEGGEPFDSNRSAPAPSAHPHPDPLPHSEGDSLRLSRAGEGEEQVEAVLDWLEAHRYLSTERFVESRIHAREARFGNQRIRAELAQHGTALTPEQLRRLRESELERAAAVLARRYPEPPETPAERAARHRFLAARGFSPEVIGRALRGAG